MKCIIRDLTKPRRPRTGRDASVARAFTLIELLVSMTILAILMLLTTQVISQMQKGWMQTASRSSQFREARAAFDLITHNLSQAVLNPYWETDQGGLSAATYVSRTTSASALPTKFLRKSDLQFICGPSVGGGGQNALVNNAPTKDSAHLPFSAVFFQATLGVTQITNYDNMQTLLCGRGYFVEFGDDTSFRPTFIPPAASSNRFRLMEYSPTAERNSIYSDELKGNPPTTWFSDAGSVVTDANGGGNNGAVPITRGFTRPIAENIIALIIAPRVSDVQAAALGVEPHYISGPNYTYDSTQNPGAMGTSTTNPQGSQNLLPPLVDVIMVALDDASAAYFGTAPTPNSTASIQPLTNLFTAPANLNNDLQTLQGLLVNMKPAVNFRIFKATVEIRSARWSL